MLAERGAEELRGRIAALAEAGKLTGFVFVRHTIVSKAVAPDGQFPGLAEDLKRMVTEEGKLSSSAGTEGSKSRGV